MLKHLVGANALALILLIGQVPASYHENADPQICNNRTGIVMKVVNDELFTISVCNKMRVFKEFSYCYGIEIGDTVLFDNNIDDCVMISFTDLRNDVQCGLLCQ